MKLCSVLYRIDLHVVKRIGTQSQKHSEAGLNVRILFLYVPLYVEGTFLKKDH